MFKESKGLLFFVFINVLFTKFLQAANETNVVKTTLGDVRGILKQTAEGNLNFYAYLGIPFAKKPIGDLRFKEPVPIDPWTGTFNASSDPPMCIQGYPIISNLIGTDGVEDCLYLNIYAPVQNNSEPLPVIIWVYGGGFIGGYSGYSLYRPDYFLDQGVIFVSFNYRLGIFGFLSLEDSVLPGNSGLKDQVLAIKWFKDNIANFGGNISQMTVFGESAGAAAVSYLMQSPLTEGLFQGAIMNSGNTVSSWSLTRNSASRAKILAGLLGISTASSTSILVGLQKIDANTLLQVSNSPKFLVVIQENLRNGFPFGPVIEPSSTNAFFTKRSFEALTVGDIHKIPCISGYNSLEGILFVEVATLLYKPQFVVNLATFIPEDTHMDINKAPQAGKEIKDFYYNGSILNFFNPNGSYAFVKFISDDLFTRAQVKYVELVSKFTKVYFYQFSYEGALGATNRKYPGVGHAEDLRYLFYYNFTGNAADILTRKRMVKLWTNFAKTGNPTPNEDPLFQNIIWPTAREGSDPNQLSYLNISSQLNVGINPDKKFTDFWNAFYDKYGRRPYETY